MGFFALGARFHRAVSPDTTSGMSDSAGHKITADEVRHVAKLSRLAIDESRLPELTRRLEPILHYIEQINSADVTGVEPMSE